MYKYKECHPEETINKIKTILNQNKIKVVEGPMQNSFERFYSVRVSLEDSDTGTNGKGITPSLALASAYAEFMERLQNNMLVSDNDKLNYEIRTSSLERVCLTDVQGDPIVGDVICGDLPTKDKLIELWIKVNEGEMFAGRWLHEVNGESRAFFPDLMRIVYGSNGMAAGNSAEEAIVQAVCEIFERYSAHQIINGVVAAPNYDMEVLKQEYPIVDEYVRLLSEYGDYKVIIKDCSLGKDLPVVALIIIDNERHKFALNFGAHPKFEIAVERTFTEVFQGKNISEIGVSINNNTIDKLGLNNDLGFFRNGRGYASNKIFTEECDYDATISHFDVTSQNIQELFNYIKKCIASNELKAYVTKSDRLGFPTVQVIIPGMSTIFKQDEFAIRYRIMRKNVMKKIGEFHNLSLNEQKEILAFSDYSRKTIFGQSFIRKVFVKKMRISDNIELDGNLVFLMFGYIFVHMNKNAYRICEVILIKYDYDEKIKEWIQHVLEWIEKDIKDFNNVDGKLDVQNIEYIKSCIKDSVVVNYENKTYFRR